MSDEFLLKNYLFQFNHFNIQVMYVRRNGDVVVPGAHLSLCSTALETPGV